jgi:heterodisulfide reductase subunit A
MRRKVVVIGGGPAGLESAGCLAQHGFEVTVLEKEKNTGGHLNNWYHLFPDRKDSKEVLNYLDKQTSSEKIKILGDMNVTGLRTGSNGVTVISESGNEFEADAVIVATGFDLFRSERKEEYGYGIYDNVISSADLEKMFRSGDLKRHDGRVPEKIGFVHCVGSRDEKVGNVYCSKLCCVTAVKQAIELRTKIPSSKVYCFYMDMRMGGAMYEELYRESQEKYSVNYIRGKMSEVAESIDGKLIVKVEDTLVGRPLKMELDLLVLMAGMEMSASGQALALSAGIKTGTNRFFGAADQHFGSNLSNIGRVYLAGSCTAPMNITETISHARAAAMELINSLNT